MSTWVLIGFFAYWTNTQSTTTVDGFGSHDACNAFGQRVSEMRVITSRFPQNFTWLCVEKKT